MNLKLNDLYDAESAALLLLAKAQAAVINALIEDDQEIDIDQEIEDIVDDAEDELVRQVTLMLDIQGWGSEDEDDDYCPECGNHVDDCRC